MCSAAQLPRCRLQRRRLLSVVLPSSFFPFLAPVLCLPLLVGAEAEFESYQFRRLLPVPENQTQCGVSLSVLVAPAPRQRVRTFRRRCAAPRAGRGASLTQQTAPTRRPAAGFLTPPAVSSGRRQQGLCASSPPRRSMCCASSIHSSLPPPSHPQPADDGHLPSQRRTRRGVLVSSSAGRACVGPQPETTAPG